MTAENKGKVTIVVPTRIEVDASRLDGDIEREITSEILPGEEQRMSEATKRAIERGARVFVTEGDGYLILEPEQTAQP